MVVTPTLPGWQPLSPFAFGAPGEEVFIRVNVLGREARRWLGVWTEAPPGAHERDAEAFQGAHRPPRVQIAREAQEASGGVVRRWETVVRAVVYTKRALRVRIEVHFEDVQLRWQ